MGPRIDVRRALTYMFEDERWVWKLLIGAALSLGPVLLVGIFFLIGYLGEIVRRVAAGADRPLPEWRGHFGTYLREGFPAAWGLLIWLLPFAAVWAVAGLAVGAAGVASSIAVQLVFGLSMMVLANLYAAVVVPPVIARYAADPRFGSMFEVGQIVSSIRRTGRGFVPVWVVHLVVLVLTFVTIWTIFAIIFTTAYAVMAFGHVYGQAARGETD